jgi:uncharacterized membrane protein
MNKMDYLSELERELKSLSETDRSNALAYYSEYLDDAESAGQMEFSREFGSPHTLAAQIKADIAMSSPPPLFSQQVFEHQHAQDQQPGFANQQPPAPQQTPGYQQVYPYQPYPGYQQVPAAPPKRKSGIGVIWTVILAILAIPVGLPLAAALFVVIVSVLAGLFAILVSLAAVVISLFATGLLAGIVGLFLLFSSFSTGLFYLGLGLVLIGISVFFGIGFWQLARVCIKGVAKFFNSIRKRLTKKERVLS